MENNITKALINTLESLSSAEVIAFLQTCNLLSASCSLSSAHIEYALQKKPAREIIEQVPVENRFLWGISPTGRAWDVGAVPLDKISFDIPGDAIAKIAEAISDDPQNQEARREAEAQFNEIKGIHDGKGGSIPDAWILVYDGEKNPQAVPLFCIAIENKKYNLDPYQLQNHWEKSLFTTERTTVFSSYADIYRKLLEYQHKNPIVNYFLEYISLLGYEPVTSFSKIDFDFLTEEFYQNLLYRKFFRYFDVFIDKYASKNRMEYDESKRRLYFLEDERFNLLFDFSGNSSTLLISTEVGVRNHWVNETIIPILKSSERSTEALSNCYKGCYYERYVKLRRPRGRLKPFYFWIKAYDTLKDYLQNINPDLVWQSNVNKSDCYDSLLKFGISPDNNEKMKKLSQSDYSQWQWLEYLRIIREIDISNYCADNNDMLDNALENAIDQHVKGLKLFDELLKS